MFSSSSKLKSEKLSRFLAPVLKPKPRSEKRATTMKISTQKCVMLNGCPVTGARPTNAATSLGIVIIPPKRAAAKPHPKTLHIPFSVNTPVETLANVRKKIMINTSAKISNSNSETVIKLTGFISFEINIDIPHKTGTRERRGIFL